METFVKRVKLPPVPNPIPDMYWDCRVYVLSDGQYLAKLLVYDEYDGYLANWKIDKISPIFNSASEAETYVLENWSMDWNLKK